MGLIDGLLNLLGGQVVDPFGFGHEAARIHQQARRRTNTRYTVLAVPGDARQVRDQCVSGFRQCIEQGRFADVRPSDDGDYG